MHYVCVLMRGRGKERRAVGWREGEGGVAEEALKTIGKYLSYSIDPFIEFHESCIPQEEKGRKHGAKHLNKNTQSRLTRIFKGLGNIFALRENYKI